MPKITTQKMLDPLNVVQTVTKTASRAINPSASKTPAPITPKPVPSVVTPARAQGQTVSPAVAYFTAPEALKGLDLEELPTSKENPYVTQKEGTPSWLDLVSQNETASSDPIVRRYAALQDNMRAQEGSAAQAEQTALNRRFASMGALNSGAALRNSQLRADMSNRRLAEARNSLMAAQAGDEQNAFEAAAGRNLQREGMRTGIMENMAGRNVQREGMDANAREAALQRDFTGTQNAMARNLQRQTANLEGDRFNQQMGLETAKLNEQIKSNAIEAGLNTKVVDNNIAVANEMLKRDSAGMFENLFSFLGKGVSWRTPLGRGTSSGFGFNRLTGA